MDIYMITYFNIIIVIVTYQLQSYPVRRMGIFVNNNKLLQRQ